MKETFTDLSYQNLLEHDSKFQKIKKIGDYIAKLPNQKVLKDLCTTEDLQFLWWKMRCFYGQIARCLFILYLQENLENFNVNLKDIFEEALENKWITRKDIKLYKAETQRLLTEWNLIEVGFPYLIAEMQNFHFCEDIELFFDLLENQAAERIKQHTKSYHEINIHKRANLYEQIDEAARGQLDNKNKLLKNPIIYRYRLKEEIIKFLWNKSQVDQVIKQKLKALQIEHNDFYSIAAENCKNRNSKGKSLKSEVWKNGERYLLTKQGLHKYPLIEELKSHFSESSLQQTKLVLQQFINCN